LADLAITGGRVLDPASGHDGPGTVSITGGRLDGILKADDRVDATRTIDATGLLVCPGLIDTHVHAWWGVSHYGIEMDEYALGRGVTTVLDLGSAGAGTFRGFRRFVIDQQQTRIYALVNISVLGMISALAGEYEDLRWLSTNQTVEVARQHLDVVRGVKVRPGYQMAGFAPIPAIRFAREAADRLEVPLVVHFIDLAIPLRDLLEYMGEGDMLTHCFHGNQSRILGVDGKVLPEVREARERGVIFDIGHGIGSFTWQVASAAIEQGFPPTTISSDVHQHNKNGPVYDQVTTLSKLLHVGMPLMDVIRASTVTSAAALREEERLGALAEGREADVSILELREGRFTLEDGDHVTVDAEQLLVPRYAVRAGEVVECDSPVPEILQRGPREGTITFQSILDRRR
jgi:dihydroorotase